MNIFKSTIKSATMDTMDMEFIEAYDSAEESCDHTTEQDTCEHIHVSCMDGSSVCNDCGMKLNETLMDNESRFYGACDTKFAKNPTRHHQRKEEERSLYNDLVPLGFPHNIIYIANEYYKQIIKNSIYRAKNRMSIVFACTYKAYIDINEPKPPEELAKIFGLTKKSESRGIITFSKVFRNQKKKQIYAIDLVPKILSDLDLNNRIDIYEDIKTIYNYLHNHRSFKSANPQSVAAGIIFYYLDLINYPITRSEFSKIVNLTDITFNSIAEEAQRIIHK